MDLKNFLYTVLQSNPFLSRTNMQLTIAYISLAIAVTSAAIIRHEDAGKAETVRYVLAFANPSFVEPVANFTNYNPDLSLAGVDNVIYSVCQTGVWIFYNEINYDQNGGLSCLIEGINYCENINPDCSRDISSLRYAGSPDGLNNDYINLYEGKSFTGAEFRSDDTAITVGDIDRKVSSLIISGTSGWTFFTGLQFSGVGVCVIPSHEDTSGDGTVLNYSIFYEITEIGLPDNSIRSVLKGCFGNHIVRGSSHRTSHNPPAVPVRTNASN